MKRKTIEHQNYRLLESELYFYKDTKRELELMELDIVELGSAVETTIKTTGIGRPTEAKAIRLLSSKELIEVRRRVDAIEYMLEVLKNCEEPAKLKLIEMKYFERKYTDVGIWESLNISKKTYYRWKREAISLVANKLGFKV